VDGYADAPDERLREEVQNIRLREEATTLPRCLPYQTAMTVTGQILIADDEDSLRWVLEKGFRGV